jgi:transcriptional regulator with XRE-family HTH domain
LEELMLDPKVAREMFRKAVEEEFLRLKQARKGELRRAAMEIGVTRQQLQQWAKGVPVPADALLMAFMKWGVSLRVKDAQAKSHEPRWWEFSMSGRDGGFQKPRPSPVQMSLFDALNELQDDNVEVKILRKAAGRLELGLEIGFKKVKF